MVSRKPLGPTSGRGRKNQDSTQAPNLRGRRHQVGGRLPANPAKAQTVDLCLDDTRKHGSSRKHECNRQTGSQGRGSVTRSLQTFPKPHTYNLFGKRSRRYGARVVATYSQGHRGDGDRAPGWSERPQPGRSPHVTVDRPQSST